MVGWAVQPAVRPLRLQAHPPRPCWPRLLPARASHSYYAVRPAPGWRFLFLDGYDVSWLGWPEGAPVSTSVFTTTECRRETEKPVCSSCFPCAERRLLVGAQHAQHAQRVARRLADAPRVRVLTSASRNTQAAVCSKPHHVRLPACLPPALPPCTSRPPPARAGAPAAARKQPQPPRFKQRRWAGGRGAQVRLDQKMRMWPMPDPCVCPSCGTHLCHCSAVDGSHVRLLLEERSSCCCQRHTLL